MPGPNQQAQEVSERAEASAGTGGGSMLGGIAGMAVAALNGAAMLAVKMWDALTADGVLAAAGRQGTDELGAALKAFNDTIQTQESGTIFNPTQGEIAADRKGHGSGGPFHGSFYASYSHSAGPRETW